MKNSIITITILLASFSTFSQDKISGITPEKSIIIEGKTLSFNGAGLREKFFLDLYVGSLYLTNKSSSSEKVINSDETMAITIDIVSGLITSEKMINAIDEGFENSTNGKMSTFKSQIQEFKNAFSEEIIKGNDFTIAYIPTIGTVVYKNGKKIKTIKGLAFKKAVFGIWFCNKPADEGLMEDMLGLD